MSSTPPSTVTPRRWRGSTGWSRKNCCAALSLALAAGIGGGLTGIAAAPAAYASAATVYVTAGGTGTCASNSAANGLPTIAGAIACAQSGDTISVGPGTFAGGFILGPGTLTLEGAGAGQTTIEDKRILFSLNSTDMAEINLAPSSDVTVEDLTVNGNDDNAGIDGTTGRLTVHNVQVVDGADTVFSSAVGYNGIGMNPGSAGAAELTVTDSTVSGTQVPWGPEVGVDSSAASSSQATLVNDTIADNISNSDIGATHSSGAVLVVGTNAQLVNDTIDGNSGQETGGIFARDVAGTPQTRVTVANSIITGNTSTLGYASADCAELRDSSVSGVVNPVDVVDLGHNLIGTDTLVSPSSTGYTGCGLGNGVNASMSGTSTALSSVLDVGTSYSSLPVAALPEAVPAGATLQLGNVTSVTTTAPAPAGSTTIPVQSFVAPGYPGLPALTAGTAVVYQLPADLGPLADNGGPTQTQALLKGSLAIGSADPAVCTASPVDNLDQRGDPRNAGTRGTCDIGAYDTGGTSNTPVWTAGPSGPPARSDAAIATSPSGLTLMFGGAGANHAFLGDTWELASPSGAWKELTSTAATVPAGRTGAAMVWDAALSEFVLFGGAHSTGFLSDTWTFDPRSGEWSQVATHGSPAPRAGATLAAEPDGTLVLFGGLGYEGYLGDTWAFDPSTSSWVQLTDVTGPSPRYAASMAADPVSGTIVLFGGVGPKGPDADTWQYAAGKWSPVTATGTVPAPRFFAGLAYDTSTGTFVLAEGLTSSGYSNQAFAFDPGAGSWSQLAVPGAPSPRDAANLTYDPATGDLMQFGGWNGSNFFGDTWELHA